MRKILTLLILSLVFLPSLVRAQSTENVTKRRPDRPTQVEIQEVRQGVKDAKANLLSGHISRLERRFGFYSDRLGGIIARFQSRLDLLSDEDKDVSSAQTQLDLAQTKLISANDSSLATLVAFKAIDPTRFAEQKIEIMAARDSATATRALYQEVHELLKKALLELKTSLRPSVGTKEDLQ